MRVLLILSLITGLASAATSQQPEYEMSFFVRDDFARDLPNVFSHPCGTVMTVRLTEIPLFPENGPVIASEVVEFDDTGEIVGSWQLPADYEIAGVQDDTLLVIIATEQYLIGQTGSINLAPEATREAGERRSCPISVLQRFGSQAENAYLSCSTMQDRRSGTERNLAFEGVCT